MSTNAFIDKGYQEGRAFCLQFLSSPEFNINQLQAINSFTPHPKGKNDLAAHIVQYIVAGDIKKEDVLISYVKQPRTWLSLKQGACDLANLPKLHDPKELLFKFSSDDWYGPILDKNKAFYIRTQSIPYYLKVKKGTENVIEERRIRWPVIAEVQKGYLALSWNNFSYNHEQQIDQSVQFPFWNYIPNFIEEIENILGGTWIKPNLHKLILNDFWDKYTRSQSYNWQHLRIRAEAAGVALNAHSSGVAEIDVRGIQALSHEIAESAVKTLGFGEDKEKVNRVENAVLLTLIKGWGTKSYEFSLDKKGEDSEPESAETEETDANSIKKVFRAHCYFGFKENSKTQDSLQHLKCYQRYGGSNAALAFLISELSQV